MIHYETSNFARENFFSKHNFGYWDKNLISEQEHLGTRMTEIPGHLTLQFQTIHMNKSGKTKYFRKRNLIGYR